jgi:site-specific recombinase XerD
MNAGAFKLSDLTPTHLEQFWEQQSSKLAGSTLYTRHCLLHKFLYWLDSQGFLRFAVDPPRMRHMRLLLSEPAQRFLEIRGHRQHEPVIRNLHDWLQRKSIALEDLTPAHLEAFLRRPIAEPLAKRSRERVHRRLEPYLMWLHEQGIVCFRAGREVRKPFPLPISAQDFVNTLRPVRKPQTCSSYLINLRDFHAWLAAQDLSLDTLDRDAAGRWLKSLAERDLAPTTRNSRIFHVRNYLTWLSEKGVIVADPHDLLRASDLPKIPTYLPRPFPVEADRELQRRFRQSGTPYGQALFLMRRSGVRIGELVCLELRCVDEDLHGNIFLKVPLGKLDNERLVPLDDETSTTVLSLQQLSPRGAPFLILPEISRQNLKRQLSATLKDVAAGLDIPGPVVSHRLRHTYATELLNAGMSLIGIMKLLGHRSLRMTMRYAAITQNTVVKDFYAAMAKISPQYELSETSSAIDEPDPDRMLRDVISYLRNHAADDSRANRLISRIHKLRHDLASISTAPLQP